MKFFVEYVFFRFFIGIVRFLSFFSSIKVGKMLGKLISKLDAKRTLIAFDNISMALDLKEKDAKVLTALVFENLGRTIVEFLQPGKYGQRYIAENVDVQGLENIKSAVAMGKGVLVLSAHLGNWELLGAALSEHAGQVTVVYKKTRNPFVSRFFHSTRLRRGIKTIPHVNSARKIMGLLKKGETVGILLDQYAVGSEAIKVDFFGMPAATNYGLALIALKTGAPVVPAFMVRDEKGGYRCIYEEAIYLEKSDDRDADIKAATTRFNEVLEKQVRSYPEQWFWVHNRWKVKQYSKKKI